MKSNAERIAELEKAMNDLSNRYHTLEDRVRVAEAALAESKSLEAAVDAATVKANTLGV